MDGVGTFAAASHAVERGDAYSGGKVSIGSAAYGGFFELPVDFFRDLPRLLIEAGYSCGAFHWEAVDSAFDRELAMLVEGLQDTHFAVQTFCLLGALDADIDFDCGFGGDDV